MPISVPYNCYKPGYSELNLVSPDNNIWNIGVTNMGAFDITDTATAFVAGSSPFSSVPSLIYETSNLKLIMVDPSNNEWEMKIDNLGVLSFSDMADSCVFGAAPSNVMSNVFSTSYYKLKIVAPDTKIYEITITNAGVMQTSDTGDTY